MTDSTVVEDTQDRAGRPRSRGTINPTEIQMIPRHAGRIERLRLAIAKAAANDDHEKLASLQAELDRRIASLSDAKQLLENI